mmetsp:Transcript_2033/g.4586  ORF Transcript_2033/g.4586 Transcript_2033/m.4586 type:complete len:428 (-) Transcript_2033:117-1400(-)
MAVGSSLVVLWFAKSQITGKSSWTGIKVDLDNVGNELGGESVLLSSVGLDEQTQWLGDTNGVRQLDKSTLTKSSLDDGLGHPTARVGGRSIDLGGILSRKGTSSVGSPSTVSINDNLTSGKTGITLGSTNDELSRGINVKVASIAAVNAQSRFTVLELDGLESGDNDVLVDEFVHFFHGGSNHFLSSVLSTVISSGLFLGTLGLEWFGVLSGNDNSVDLDGSDSTIGVLGVLNGDLGLSIGAQPPERTILTDIGEALSELSSHHVGQRHAVFGFIRSISKHDTLITGTNVKITLTDVDSSGNIGRLLVDSDEDFAVVAVQSLGGDGSKIIDKGVESNLTNLFTDNGLVVDLSGSGDFTKDHDHVVLGGGLTSDLGVRIGLQASIQDGIGDLIGKLIGVTLVHRLTGEKEVTFFGGDFNFCHFHAFCI